MSSRATCGVGYEREVVNELDSRRSRQELVRVAARRLAGREAEHRPDPLASAGERVAHRLPELAELGGESELVEVLLDQSGEIGRRRHDASFARVSSASTS